MPLYNPDIGFISTIQKYSTKDGPGIRDTVFFKGCSLGCLWCSNPELIRSQPDILYHSGRCVRCGECVKVCPHSALTLDKDQGVTVDRDLCSGCGECVDECLQNALELVGRYVRVDELAEELLKDQVFYQASGGGVTFSGGEPLYQSGFLRKVAEELQLHGIHTALDTAGDVSWCRFEEVLASIDLVLYDLKAAHPKLHRMLTGRENDLILANAALLAQQDVPVIIRLVVVPGLNDSREDIENRMRIVSTMPNVIQIDLLPYHRYGVGKYAQLGLDYPLEGLKEDGDARIEELRSWIAAYGYPTTIGG